MMPTTLEIVRAALRADATILPDERTRLLVVLKNGGAEKTPTAPTTPRLVRRIEAAKMLGGSLRLVDKLSASGALIRRTLPGRTRSCGFLEADIFKLIAGRAA
jgi:hypothetical protein